ncbi:MAG TPA: ribonuclease P protein component [Candidatus Magasanikbacteria bacterium]|nr:MAG: ribonuclease P protein component [Candidatus Magasanikbacteria bacterium RIFOXYC2_FULL_39_8]HAT04022.1 ribonuclease P protein component [Candidatus Magasanikbacteria bacterium]
MLPKQHRLKHMKDWQILFDEGRFFGGECVTLKVWKIDPEKYPRRKYSLDDLLIGFAVGTKVHKSAVKRNRAKRQMREVIRLLLKENKASSGFLVGVIAKSCILDKDYAFIEQEITTLFKKAKLII